MLKKTMTKCFFIALLLVKLMAPVIANASQVEQNISNQYIKDTQENLDREFVIKKIEQLDVTVIAPASGLSEAEIPKFHEIFDNKSVHIPDAALLNKNIRFVSDSVENRIKYFIDAINSNHKVIWCLRGGHGSFELIEELNKLPIPEEKKTLIGYSDITAMNLFLSQKWGWKTIHAPMLRDLLPGNFTYEKFDLLLKILANEIDSYTINEIKPFNALAESSVSINGKLTGGNINLVQMGIGTPWEIDTKDKIVFLETASGYNNAYMQYRYLYQLYAAGKLKGAKAILFGALGIEEANEEIDGYISEFAKLVNIPVFITNQFGCGRHNMPLVYNADATIHDNKLTIFLTK